MAVLIRPFVDFKIGLVMQFNGFGNDLKIGFWKGGDNKKQQTQ